MSVPSINTLGIYAAQPLLGKQLEGVVITAVNRDRLEEVNKDISMARTDNSFDRIKELIKGF